MLYPVQMALKLKKLKESSIVIQLDLCIHLQTVCIYSAQMKHVKSAKHLSTDITLVSQQSVN